MERKGEFGSSQQSSSAVSNIQGFPENTYSSSSNTVSGAPLSSVPDAASPFISTDVNNSTNTYNVTASDSASSNTVFGIVAGGSGFGIGSSSTGSSLDTRSGSTGYTFGSSGRGFGSGVNTSGSGFTMSSTGFGSGMTIGRSGFGSTSGMGQGVVSGGPSSSGFNSGSSAREITFESSRMRSVGPVSVPEMGETKSGSGSGGTVSGSSVFGTGISVSQLGGSQPFSTGFGAGSSGMESGLQLGFGSHNPASGIGQRLSSSLNTSGLAPHGFTSNSSFRGNISTGFNFKAGEKSGSSTTVSSTSAGVMTGFNSGTRGSVFGMKTSPGLFGAATNSVNKCTSEVSTSVFGGRKSSFSIGITDKVSSEQKTSFEEGHPGTADKVSHPEKPSVVGTISSSGAVNRTRSYVADVSAQERQFQEENPDNSSSLKAGVSLFGGRFISPISSSNPSIFGGKRESESSRVSRERGEPRFTFSLNSGQNSTGFGSESSGSCSGFSVTMESNETAAHAAGPSGHKRGADREENADMKRERLTHPETEDRQQLGQDNTSHPSDSGTPEKRSTRRASLLERIGNKTSIVCKRVAAKYNRHSILREHFSKFGEVVKIRLAPAKMSATIYFKTHEAAARAKAHGQCISPSGQPLTIFWKNSQSDKSPGDQQETKERYGLHRISSQASTSLSEGLPAEDSRQKLAKKTMPLSDTVASELESMAGCDSGMGDPDYKVLSRPGEKRSQAALASRQHSPSRHSPPPSTSRVPSSLLKQNQLSSIEGALAMLRKAMATTTTEKISMLEARDKLLRQARSRKTSTSIHSQAFVGTCPDMCPEKERLYREEVRRLSIYEIIPGSSTHTGSTSLVDHSKAVKEYSRSSADQEEPLSHELRPLPVLVMTMTYLLKEIAENGEDGKWAEWYDFLWNRTRGIRKDITQQQLCSREVAGLIEKCARFHIYCSERLCEEDMMVFDSKINNENLTKCLQTLQEIYADLENKHNIFCPTEPEFRAYMVLMKLNEGDTLRQIQQLRSSVRNSPEIEFAVKAYSALNSNNYVRFFRLVKSASFLNACILHRYFSQVRARALRIMLMAHGSGARQRVLFPVSELKRLLAFESESQVREFCENYGMATDGLDVVLERSAYVEPESSVPAWRAKDLVESKCMVSVGEVINGEPLPTVFHLPMPHSSFDSQGRFTGSLEDIAEAVTTVTKQQELEPQQAVRTYQPASSADGAQVMGDERAAINEAVKWEARSLFWEVIEEMSREVSSSLFEGFQLFVSFSTPVMEDIVTETTRQLAEQVCGDVLQTERARQQKMAEEEDRERRERITLEVTNLLLSEMLENEIVLVADTYLRETRAQEEIETRAQGEIVAELCTQVTRELVSEVVDVLQRLHLLSDLKRVVELKRQAKFLCLWRQEYAVRQRQKRAMLEFPSAPSMLPAQNCLQDLLPDRPHHVSPFLPHRDGFLVNRRAHLMLLSPLEAERRALTLTAHLSLACLVRHLQCTSAWKPLKLPSLLKEPLMSSVRRWPETGLLGGHIYWKLLLVLPDEDDVREKPGGQGEVCRQNTVTTISQWLRAKFSYSDKQHPQTSGQGILSLYRVPLAMSGDNSARPVSFSICVRTPSESWASKGTQSAACDLKSVVKGTSAIMCLLPHRDTTDNAVWKACGWRLNQLLKAKPSLPPVPLVLLLPCGVSTSPAVTGSTPQQLAARLGIEGLVQQRLVSQVTVADLPLRPEHPVSEAVTLPVFHSQLTKAVCWLAANTPDPPCLTSAPLRGLVEDILTEHFFTPVLQDLHARRQQGKLHQSPNTLIDLYNSVLDHVALAVTSPALGDISWPAPEMVTDTALRDGLPPNDWNSKTHLADIYQLLISLRLPWFHYEDKSAVDWSHVCRDVWKFISDVCPSHTPSVTLTTRISRLLARTCIKFEHLYNLRNNEDCAPLYVNAPWTDIMLACVNFRLENLYWKEEDDADAEVHVFYKEDDVAGFEPPATWVYAVMDTEDIDTYMEETVDQAGADDDEDMAVDSNMSFNNNCLSEDTCQTQGDVQGHDEMWKLIDSSQLGQSENWRMAFDLSSRLLTQMEEEKHKTHEFERYLEGAMRGETEDRSLTTASGSSMQHSLIVSSAILATDVTQSPPTAAVPPASRIQSGQAARLDDGPADQMGFVESIESLKESIAAQKRADELFEKHLLIILDT